MDRGPLSQASCIHRLRIELDIPESISGSFAGDQAIEARMRAAAGAPLREALARTFDRIENGDPEAVWAIRSLDVRSIVPVTVSDPDVIADRLAADVLAAVCRAVAVGTPDCVRFESRAIFVAAFVRAIIDRTQDSWIFRRLAVARELPPATALIVAGRLVEADLIDLLLAAIDEGVWETMVERLSVDDALQLSESIRRALPEQRSSTASRQRIATVAAELLHTHGPLARPIVRLLALGRLLHHCADDEVGELIASAVDHRQLTELAHLVSTGPDDGSAHSRVQEPGAPTDLPTRFTSAGVAAFVVATVLPDVADELALSWMLEASTDGFAVRADVIRRLLHVGATDPAVLLAAGWRSSTPPNEFERRPDSARLAEIAAAIGGHGGEPLARTDREWLATDAPLADGDAHEPLVALAGHLGRTFTARLIAFRSTSFEYLVPRLLGSWGLVTIDDETITVDIEAPPLLVVLQLAGLADFVATLPWRPEVIVVRHEVRS